MANFFFPRDRTFWVYHGTLMAALSLIQGATILAWGEKWKFDVAVHLLWIPFFTVGLLAFRAHYRGRNWYRLGMGTLIPLGLGYAAGVALLSVVASLAIALPVFWDYLFAPEFLSRHDTTIGAQLVRLVALGTLSGHLFASAWIFIYISVTTTRRARESELARLQLQASLRESRLAQLTHQLNPHFLFNSLNNIRFVVHENPQRADGMITALSEILRYSLESSDRQEVGLDEELAVIQRYVEIVQLQHEGRFRFTLEVPEHARRFPVPPMCLQLLVENAVKHGIEQIREGGEVSMKVTDEGDRFSVTVTSPLPRCRDEARTTTGMGLANIRNRLQLLYGDRACLATEDDGREFKASVRLPTGRT